MIIMMAIVTSEVLLAMAPSHNTALDDDETRRATLHALVESEVERRYHEHRTSLEPRAFQLPSGELSLECGSYRFCQATVATYPTLGYHLYPVGFTSCRHPKPL